MDDDVCMLVFSSSSPVLPIVLVIHDSSCELSFCDRSVLFSLLVSKRKLLSVASFAVTAEGVVHNDDDDDNVVSSVVGVPG